MIKKIGFFTSFSPKNTIKTLSILLFITAFSFIFSNAHAACQEISFGEQQSFCFDIKKTNTNFFRAESSNIKGNLQNITCSLILPNDDKVELKNCVGDFRYEGNQQKIELTATLNDRYYILITNYDFQNGQFAKYESNQTPYTPYQNFQIYFDSVSSQRNERNQDIDFKLKIRNTGTSSEYFQGTVDLSVQTWNGSQWREAASSDYDLDSHTLQFSTSERGEKNLTSFLRFYTSGEYRLVATIRNTQSSSSQIFYISNNSYNRYSNDTYYSRYNSFEYTNKERSKLRAIYNIRPDVIQKLKNQYPKLRNSSYWQYSSDEMYHNMNMALYEHRNAKFTSWKSFYAAFGERLNLTLRTR